MQPSPAGDAAVDASMNDAGVTDSGTDAGDDSLHILDIAPPPFWADGGPVTWRMLSFEELCRDGSHGRLDPQINARGTALIGCDVDGGQDGFRPDDAIVLSSGPRQRLTPQAVTQVLMADDTYWHQSENQNDKDWHVYRRHFDGGVMSKLRYRRVLDATMSGWISLEHWGDLNGEREVAGPDGGVWPVPRSSGYVLGLSEQGVGVGQSSPKFELMVWKDGKTQVSKYGAQSCWGNDINESNLIAGQRFVGGRRATLFWGNEYHEVPLTKGDASEVLGVNNLGVAVGKTEERNFPTRLLGWGFAWARGHSIILDDLVQDAGVDCLILTANDINDSNQVVGIAQCEDAGFSYYRLQLGLDP